MATLRRQAPFARHRILLVTVMLLLYAWLLLAKSPTDRSDWWLENVPLLAFLLVMALTYRKFAFRTSSYVLMAIFCLLHVVGAHYGYQNTPFDTWLRAHMGVQRSMYDRVVHTAFGLFLVAPLLEIAGRAAKLRGVWRYIFALAVLMAASALYEIAEMVVALIANPQLAGQYLGLQGDVLDTQKDMLSALSGAAVAAMFLALRQWLGRRHNRREHDIVGGNAANER
ncbi:MAG: DUF2238 domain-containing protein [Paenibacillaceae bacterium]|nr:DUF2238 domain-containing protein [Paenibacillaceae bacterium]